MAVYTLRYIRQTGLKQFNATEILNTTTNDCDAAHEAHVRWTQLLRWAETYHVTADKTSVLNPELFRGDTALDCSFPLPGYDLNLAGPLKQFIADNYGIELELTEDGYYYLENEIQKIRLSVMRLANSLAQAANLAVGCAHIICALPILLVTKQSAIYSINRAKTPIYSFPQREYILLEKRLHNLRLLVCWVARQKQVGLTSSEQSPWPPISSDQIVAAWATTMNNLSLINLALTFDYVP